jgi:hypothetical protein
MVGTADIEPDHVPLPYAPPVAESVADNDVPDLVSESDDASVTTEDVMESIMPRRMPAIHIQARLDLPAWFVVVVSYTFAYALGSFATRCSSHY